jgi:ferredoxin, 2Fe-2S
VAKIRVAAGPDRAEAVVEAGSAVSVLNALLAAGIRIRHDCGGKAQCGTCALRVLEGSTGLSPVREPEAARLAATGRGPGYRLACQARAARDVVVEIPAEGPRGGAPGEAL